MLHLKERRNLSLLDEVVQYTQRNERGEALTIRRTLKEVNPPKFAMSITVTCFKYSNFIVKGVLDRLNEVGGVFGEIVQRHQTSLARDKFYDCFCNAALIEPVLAVLSDFAECLG